MAIMESERRYLSRFSFRKFGVLPAHLPDDLNPKVRCKRLIFTRFEPESIEIRVRTCVFLPLLGQNRSISINPNSISQGERRLTMVRLNLGLRACWPMLV